MAEKSRSEYICKYQRDHYKRVQILLSPEMKTRWQEAADKHGMSLTAYIKQKVNGMEEEAYGPK